jgi:hypothetical protein
MYTRSPWYTRDDAVALEDELKLSLARFFAGCRVGTALGRGQAIFDAAFNTNFTRTLCGRKPFRRRHRIRL